jgi:hypothetical protein
VASVAARQLASIELAQRGPITSICNKSSKLLKPDDEAPEDEG